MPAGTINNCIDIQLYMTRYQFAEKETYYTLVLIKKSQAKVFSVRLARPCNNLREKRNKK